MENKYKRYLKLNLISLVFIGISFISITLAWFAYSGIAKVDTEIRVKAWLIEFDKKNVKQESNDIVISLDDVYPGMNPVFENVDIKNLGDSLAQISYSVTSVRVLNDNLENLGYSNDKLEDILSHEYPFHVNINLASEFAIAKTGQSKFTVSVSWPLDSGNDSEDSTWGNDSYNFQLEEQKKYNADKTYQIKSPLKIVIHLKAEQYIEGNDSVDYNYPMGSIVLFDTLNNKKCTSISTSCLKTYVIDSNNKVGDTTVTLLPDLFKTYGNEVIYSGYDEQYNNIIKDWNIPLTSIKKLSVEHLTKVISNDIINSELIRDNLSPLVIGNLKYPGNVIIDEVSYENRSIGELSRALSGNSYYKFKKQNFEYFSTSRCYWTNTEVGESVFAIKDIENTTYTKIYKELKTSSCNVIPIIEASKANLNQPI